jgi:DNA-binding NtrC family response regulator
MPLPESEIESGGEPSASDDTPTGTVLVVDDDPHVRDGLTDILDHAGHETVEARDGKTALGLVSDRAVDLILLDLQLPRVPGMEVLRQTTTEHPGVPIVIVSGKGTIQQAVEATKIGAYDFLEKPVNAQRTLVTVRNALEKARLQQQRDRLLNEARARYAMVGSSEPMQRVYTLIDKAARAPSTVLITGESGTGKELVARAIHHNSEQAGEPFVTVNCAALPESLIESELFGHKEGAFTGAKGERTGKFEQAEGGTLFLDEVGDMSLQAQAKTLRALQQKQIQPVGGEQPISVDVRLIAATNKDLRAEIDAGHFREDLFFRLNIIAIEVPPLRERREDIPDLVDHFLAECSDEHGVPRRHVEPGGMVALMSRDWPGNVRQLRNLVERLVALSEAETISTAAVQEALDASDTTEASACGADLRAARDQFEAAFIRHTLRAHEGAVQETADALGISRSHLWKKMQKYDIERGETG